MSHYVHVIETSEAPELPLSYVVDLHTIPLGHPLRVALEAAVQSDDQQATLARGNGRFEDRGPSGATYVSPPCKIEASVLIWIE